MTGQSVTSSSPPGRTHATRAGAGFDPWVVATAAGRLRAAFMGRVLCQLGRRLAGAMRHGIVEPLRRRRERAAAYRELMAKDDRLLRDIGISRGEIPLLVEGLMQPRREGPPRRRRAQAVYGAGAAKEDRLAPEASGVHGEVSVVVSPGLDEHQTLAEPAGGSVARSPASRAANDDPGRGAAA